MKKQTQNPRGKALDIVIEVLERGNFLTRTEDKFATRLATGCIERAIELDYRIDQVAKPKVKRQHPVVRNILRLGAYQLLYMDSVEDFAAINESVKLAKKRGQYRAAGFVNAVLRRLSENREQAIEDPAVRYSMPPWIYELFCERFGERGARDVMEAFLLPPDIHVRKNKNGTGYIQDISSQEVCKRAGIRAGDKVLDVCAAPGGKSIHAADIAGETGLVTARDKSPEKTARIDENINRLGFTNIKTQVRDAKKLYPEDIGAYDVVLADLPCSGLGVIRRKPEIKYRLKPGDITALAQLQWEILSVVSRYVRVGGRLIFSTCTVTEEENDNNTGRLLGEYRDFRLIESEQLVPDDKRDGFYIAIFERQ